MTEEASNRAMLANPAALPELYGVIFMGDGLEPEIANGTCLVLSKTAEPGEGDLVNVWFRPEIAPPCESSPAIFRLVLNLMPGTAFPFVDAPSSEVHPLVMLETLDPPMCRPFPADAILALHKAVGRADPDGSGVIYFGKDKGESGEQAASEMES